MQRIVITEVGTDKSLWQRIFRVNNSESRQKQNMFGIPNENQEIKCGETKLLYNIQFCNTKLSIALLIYNPNRPSTLKHLVNYK